MLLLATLNAKQSFALLILFAYYNNFKTLETSKADIIAKVRVSLYRNFNYPLIAYYNHFKTLEASSSRLDKGLTGTIDLVGHCGRKTLAVTQKYAAYNGLKKLTVA